MPSARRPSGCGARGLWRADRVSDGLSRTRLGRRRASRPLPSDKCGPRAPRRAGARAARAGLRVRSSARQSAPTRRCQGAGSQPLRSTGSTSRAAQLGVAGAALEKWRSSGEDAREMVPESPAQSATWHCGSAAVRQCPSAWRSQSVDGHGGPRSFASRRRRATPSPAKPAKRLSRLAGPPLSGAWSMMLAWLGLGDLGRARDSRLLPVYVSTTHVRLCEPPPDSAATPLPSPRRRRLGRLRPGLVAVALARCKVRMQDQQPSRGCRHDGRGGGWPAPVHGQPPELVSRLATRQPPPASFTGHVGRPGLLPRPPDRHGLDAACAHQKVPSVVLSSPASSSRGRRLDRLRPRANGSTCAHCHVQIEHTGREDVSRPRGVQLF